MITFYLSRIQGNKVYNLIGKSIGVIKDFVVDNSTEHPKIIAIAIKRGRKRYIWDYSYFKAYKTGSTYQIICEETREIKLPEHNTLYLVKNVLDKQIVDMDGRKVVRVNDIRLASLAGGTFMVAVDIGLEGLLRRIGIAKPIQKFLRLFGWRLPGKFILWDDVGTIDYSRQGIQLSKSAEKLHTLHPSDIADILEDLDKNSQIAILSHMDEEKAADVLEELEVDAQRQVIENLSLEKAADLLEKMPADEVVDLLEELQDHKVEELLSEMEIESSQEVRELMDYPENKVGSLMSTDYLSFAATMTVEETIDEIRKVKPESALLYSLFVVDHKERLVATVPLRDLIVSEPNLRLSQIMNHNFIYVFDNDKTNSLAELVQKYNLLAVPVVDKQKKMLGVIVIDDVVDELME